METESTPQKRRISMVEERAYTPTYQTGAVDPLTPTVVASEDAGTPKGTKVPARAADPVTPYCG